jgi:hypothetical protein
MDFQVPHILPLTHSYPQTPGNLVNPLSYEALIGQ